MTTPKGGTSINYAKLRNHKRTNSLNQSNLTSNSTIPQESSQNQTLITPPTRTETVGSTMASNTSRESPIEAQKRGIPPDMILDKDNCDYITSMLQQKKQNEQEAKQLDLKKQIPKTVVPPFMKNFHQMQQLQMKQQQQTQLKRQQYEQQLAFKQLTSRQEESIQNSQDGQSTNREKDNLPLFNNEDNQLQGNDDKMSSNIIINDKVSPNMQVGVGQNNNNFHSNNQEFSQREDADIGNFDYAAQQQQIDIEVRNSNSLVVQQEDKPTQRKTIHNQQPKLFDQFFRNTSTYNISCDQDKYDSINSENCLNSKQNSQIQQASSNYQGGYYLNNGTSKNNSQNIDNQMINEVSSSNSNANSHLYMKKNIIPRTQRNFSSGFEQHQQQQQIYFSPLTTKQQQLQQQQQQQQQLQLLQTQQKQQQQQQEQMLEEQYQQKQIIERQILAEEQLERQFGSRNASNLMMPNHNQEDDIHTNLQMANDNSLLESQQSTNLLYSLGNVSSTAQFNNLDASSFNISNISNIQNVSNNVSSINNQSNIMINYQSHNPASASQANSIMSFQKHFDQDLNQQDFEDKNSNKKQNSHLMNSNNYQFLNTLNSYIDYFSQTTTTAEVNTSFKNQKRGNSKIKQDNYFLMAQLEQLQEKYKESETSRQILIADLSKLKQRDVEYKKKLAAVLEQNQKLQKSVFNLNYKLRHTQEQLAKENIEHENQKFILSKVLQERSSLPGGDEFLFPSSRGNIGSGYANRKKSIQFPPQYVGNNQMENPLLELQGGNSVKNQGIFPQQRTFWSQQQGQLNQNVMKNSFNQTFSKPQSMNMNGNSNNNNQNFTAKIGNNLSNQGINNNYLNNFNQSNVKSRSISQKQTNYDPEEPYFKQQQYQLSQVQESEPGQSAFDQLEYQDFDLDQSTDSKSIQQQQIVPELDINHEIQASNIPQESFQEYIETDDQPMQQFLQQERGNEELSDNQENMNYHSNNIDYNSVNNGLPNSHFRANINPNLVIQKNQDMPNDKQMYNYLSGQSQYQQPDHKKGINSLDEEHRYQMMRLQHMDNSHNYNTLQPSVAKRKAIQQSHHYYPNIIPSNFIQKTPASNNLPRSYVGRTMSVSYSKPSIGSPERLNNQYQQVQNQKFKLPYQNF